MVATLIPERRDSSAILIPELSADFGIVPLLAMEKGLLTTFGRVMPVGMTVATALAIIIAMRRRWDAFQIVRASLQLLGFVLVTVGVLG